MSPRSFLKSTQIKVTRNSFRAVRCPAEMWLVMGAELATLFWDIDYSKLIIFKKRQTQEEALTCPLTARDPVPGRGRASQVTTVSYELVWQTSRSTTRPLGSKSSLRPSTAQQTCRLLVHCPPARTIISVSQLKLACQSQLDLGPVFLQNPHN